MTSSLTTDKTSDLHVVAIRDEYQLRVAGQQWNTLAGDVPFLGWNWANAWWRHYQDSHKTLLVLMVLDGHGELAGVAPWYLDASLVGGRVVRFLGSGEVCSDYLTILCRPTSEDAVCARIAEFLANDAAGAWDWVDLNGAEQGDPRLRLLGDHLTRRGLTVERRPDQSCWRVELPEHWDEFLARLSKSRRERTRSLLRRTIDNQRAVVHRVETEADLERAFPILVELHQKRRQSLSQAGCFASPRFTEFHRQAAHDFLTAGQLRMFWIELEGRPVAAEYGFVGGDTVYYYQGGFEPAAADERPGWLSFAVSLRLAIEEGYQSYDFLRGDESYKASWGATPRPLVRMAVVADQTAARFRHAARRGCESARSWARGLLVRGKGQNE